MAQEIKPPPDQQERLYADIRRELIALTPDLWDAAVLEVSVEESDSAVLGMSHTITSPHGHREPIMPSDELMNLTHDLLMLFRKHGPGWRLMRFEINMSPEGNWRYDCNFDYE